ncbi:MAG: hypothetical protein ACWA5X_06295 [bacterium]
MKKHLIQGVETLSSAKASYERVVEVTLGCTAMRLLGNYDLRKTKIGAVEKVARACIE